MPINKSLIVKKLDFLNAHLACIEKMRFSKKQFVEDIDIQDLVTFRLQQSIETCIDIAAHIVAELDVPRKETVKDTLLLLGKKKIIDQNLASRMGMASDFRNRVVHGYNDFDFSLLYNDLKNNLKDLREFGKQILQYIEKG